MNIILFYLNYLVFISSIWELNYHDLTLDFTIYPNIIIIEYKYIFLKWLNICGSCDKINFLVEIRAKL